MIVEWYHWRGGDYAWHLNQHGTQVVNGQKIGRDVSLCATLVFGVNQIRADRLNLIQDILLARHADGDYENE